MKKVQEKSKKKQNLNCEETSKSARSEKDIKAEFNIKLIATKLLSDLLQGLFVFFPPHYGQIFCDLTVHFATLIFHVHLHSLIINEWE